MEELKSLKKNSVVSALDKLCLSPVSLILFIIIAVVPATSVSEYTLRLLITCMLHGVLGMGFDLSAGYISVANWGYSALMGLGGYASALMVQNMGLSPWVGMVIGALVAALMGLVVGLLTLRMDGIFAALLAWFVGLILMNTISALPDITRGALGLQVEPLFSTPWAKPYYYVIFVICIVTFIILKKIVRSNWGLAFRALGQDMQAAQTTGISPLKYRLINFVISCLIAGVCGGFYAHFIGVLTPGTLSTKNTIEILVICYLGGRGSIWGPLLASFIITPIFESLNSLVELKYIIYGFVLILVMIFMPEGISGRLMKLKNWVVERKQKKQID